MTSRKQRHHNWTYARSQFHGPLTRYAKLRVAHAPGMPRTFSPPPTSKETASERSRHASRHVRHARAVMPVGIANPRWQGKPSRHSRRMSNPPFYVSDKRSMAEQLSVNERGRYMCNFVSHWFKPCPGKDRTLDTEPGKCCNRVSL